MSWALGPASRNTNPEGKAPPMPKQPTSPAPTIAENRPVPFLWPDVVSLMDTHSLRVTKADSRDSDVQTVRRAIRRYLRHHDLPTDGGYAVPLYWVHQWLMNGPRVALRIADPDSPARAAAVLVSALNAPGSGLEVVRQRRMQYSA